MKKIHLIIALSLISIFSFSQGYKIGDKAEDFSIKNIDGKNVSLKDFDKANGYILIFTTNHCPYAKAYEERIIQLDKKYKAKGYPVIAINPNDPELSPEDSYDKMKVRAREKGFTFPYLFDEKQEVYRKYGATRTPHVFILKKDKNGLLVKYIGAIDDNYEEPAKVQNTYAASAVDALISGKDPNPAETKAIGCSIKDKSKKN